MWTTLKLIAAVAALAVQAAGSIAAADSAGKAATKGQVALEVARAAGLSLPRGGDAKEALSILRASGIDLGVNPDRKATQADLVRVGKAVGVKVAAPRPAAPVTASLTLAFSQSIKGSLQQSLAPAGGQGGSGELHVSCRGAMARQERKGTPASQANPNATATPADIPGCQGSEPIP
jgi:hypothetical protein